MGNEAELPLSVTLTMTEETRTQLAAAGGVVAEAEGYVIDCADVAVMANEDLRLVKEKRARIEALRKSFIQPAVQIIDNANALFKPPLEALARAEVILKQRLLAYQEAEERKIAEARREFEERERKARQEAEQRAAAERAKAEAEAKRQRELAAEQEAARQRLEAEGKARAAKQAAAEAAKSRAAAEQALENGETKARQLELSAAAMPSAPIPEATKLDGFQSRENWVAEAYPDETEEGALKAIVAGAVARPELLALLKINWPAVHKLAKALKKQFNVPGLVARNRPIAAQRS